MTDTENTGKRTSRKLKGSGSGAWAGYAMALMLGARYITPLLRGLGPHVRHGVIGLVALAVPAGAGVRQLLRKREDREIREARERRERMRAVREGSRKSASPGETGAPRPDEGAPDGGAIGGP